MENENIKEKLAAESEANKLLSDYIDTLAAELAGQFWSGREVSIEDAKKFMSEVDDRLLNDLKPIVGSLDELLELDDLTPYATPGSADEPGEGDIGQEEFYAGAYEELVTENKNPLNIARTEGNSRKKLVKIENMIGRDHPVWIKSHIAQTRAVVLLYHIWHNESDIKDTVYRVKQNVIKNAVEFLKDDYDIEKDTVLKKIFFELDSENRAEVTAPDDTLQAWGELASRVILEKEIEDEVQKGTDKKLAEGIVMKRGFTEEEKQESRDDAQRELESIKALYDYLTKLQEPLGALAERIVAIEGMPDM